jgi:cation diffusion facilitator family transporter
MSYIEGALSTAVNTGLFAAKLWAGSVTGSVAMLADAWHTLSDTLTSLVVVAGAWAASKPGDSKHPFGHGRAELISAVIIGSLLGMVSINFLVDSVEQLRSHTPVNYPPLPVIVFAVSAVVKEILALFSIWAGRTVESRALVADGWHHRSDAVASVVIVAGALAGEYVWWIDGALGLAVSVLIAHAAWEVLRGAADLLMGQDIEEHDRTALMAIIEEAAPGALEAHHFHVHRYGDHKEISLHLRFRCPTMLEEAHSEVSCVELRAREELGIELTIHMEPAQPKESQ